MPYIWDVGPLVGLGEGDWVLQPVEVLGVSDGVIIGSDRHDALGNELLLLFVLRGSSPPKDGCDGLGGVLVDRAYVLLPSSALAIFGFVVFVLWPLCIFYSESPV